VENNVGRMRSEKKTTTNNAPWSMVYLIKNIFSTADFIFKQCSL
jgi:hypothetical protein